MLDPTLALDALIHEVEAQAAEKPDPVANLVGILKLVIASEADPYLLSGVLVEGIASTILYQPLLNPTLAPHVMAGPTSWPAPRHGRA